MKDKALRQALERQGLIHQYLNGRIEEGLGAVTRKGLDKFYIDSINRMQQQIYVLAKQAGVELKLQPSKPETWVAARIEYDKGM